MSNLKANADIMKLHQLTGVEIEMYGLSQYKCAKYSQEYFNDKYNLNYPTDERSLYRGDHLNNYVFIDHKGREWNVYTDASIIDEYGNSRRGANCCELATAPIEYDEIPLLQELVRMYRSHGAHSDSAHNCGIHIHVSMDVGKDYGHTPKSIRNLANIVKSHERLIAKAIGFSYEREGYSEFMNDRLISELNTKKPKTWEALMKLHYKAFGYSVSEKDNHYSHTRYHFLNLHAIFNKWGRNSCTVEFRCFEFHKSMHAGELKSYIQLCLAMSSYAKLVSFCSPTEVYDANEKYCMKNWLNNLGLVGDEFKTCRKMLMKRLDGDMAYRVPRTTRIDGGLDDLDME